MGYNLQKHSTKYFSVLGDSISTLVGYNPPGYKVFYTGENCRRSNVYTMSDTWWGKVIAHFNGKLLVNNSWSGSRVTWTGKHNSLNSADDGFPSGCSNRRTTQLHRKHVKPDIILVYMGTNDWGYGVRCVQEDQSPDQDFSEFCCAYEEMLKRLRRNYPESEIWCCTLSETCISANPEFVFPDAYGGIPMDVYNQVIWEACRKYNGRLIDLYQYHMPYDSMDGTHPTSAGMQKIADMVINSVEGFNESSGRAKDEISI